MAENMATYVGVVLLGAFGIAALSLSLFGDGSAPYIGSATDLAWFFAYLMVVVAGVIGLARRRRLQ